VHAGLDALGTTARLPGRQALALGGSAGEPHPFLALPAHGALDLTAVLEADQGRHGLDVEPERALERIVVEHRAHTRREGRIVLADHGQRTGAVEALHHRLDQNAGRTIALGDDDQAVAGEESVRHGARSFSFFSSPTCGGGYRRGQATDRVPAISDHDLLSRRDDL
jgi:hypothetical protein